MNKGESGPRSRILITGVNGFVGSHLADLFVKSNYDVTGMIRKTSNLRFVEHLKIDLLICDLNDKETLRDVVADHDYIVHPAGLIQAKSPEEFMRANRDGTRSILDAAARSCPGLKRFVYVSSQAAAGPSDSMTAVNEDTPARPVSDYGKSKLAAEEVCDKFAGKMPITILRPPAVYGPRDDGTFPFFKLVKSGWFWKLGREESFASIVYVRDLADAVKMAVESENSAGQTYFVANQESPSVWHLQKLIAEVMKVEIRPLYTPVWLAKLMAPFGVVAAALTGKPPGLTKDKIRELVHRYWICDSTKAERSLGWKAETTLEKGLAETVDWYFRKRWL